MCCVVFFVVVVIITSYQWTTVRTSLQAIHMHLYLLTFFQFHRSNNLNFLLFLLCILFVMFTISVHQYYLKNETTTREINKNFLRSFAFVQLRLLRCERKSATESNDNSDYKVIRQRGNRNAYSRRCHNANNF